MPNITGLAVGLGLSCLFALFYGSLALSLSLRAQRVRDVLSITAIATVLPTFAVIVLIARSPTTALAILQGRTGHIVAAFAVALAAANVTLLLFLLNRGARRHIAGAG